MKLSDIHIRDPFILVEDNTCYLIGSTDEQIWSGKASGFLGYKSTDLKNFEGPFSIFENSDDFWADENFWAPEMFKIDGKYCIFASFFNKGHCRASQVLISDKPFGQFVPSAKPFTPEDWECLDATYYEENGHRYSIFSREHLQVIDGEICAGELNNDLTELTNVKTLFKASEAKWSVGFYLDRSSQKHYVTDGPFIYKMKNGRLLMLWSSNGPQGYALGLAYSDNGIMGDWKQFDEPLYTDDGGHGMIFEFKNTKYLIMHVNNKTFGKERAKLFKVIENEESISLEELKEE